ncbi:MAG: leucine-rich repeat domain-containing protein, partial [Clostridia bacterium]|nr:leucine-rich repeat domain-containing protein [Clostridia bacterium]
VLFDNGQENQGQAQRAKISYMPLGKTGSYTIPNGIVEIPAHAFEKSALTRVVIPSSVTTIGLEAFKDSKKLETIVFDTGSTNPLSIGDSAFMNCESLVTVNLPARLSSIALTKYELLSASGAPSAQTVSTDTGVTNAFVGCKNLENIFIANGNKNYKSINGIIYDANDVLLYCVSTVKGELVIPDGVTAIANGAFIGCTRIKEVTISGTVTSIGECAFYKTDIEKLTFNNDGFDSVTIGKYAFRDCGELKTIEFKKGNHVKVIGEGAFFGCDDLTELELPANLETVGAQAFRDCTSVEKVTISSTKDSLEFGTDVFYNCKRLSTLNLPKNVTKLPGVFGGCTSLTEVIVDEDNTHFMSDNGVLFDKEQKVILFYPSNKTNTEYVLPETVTTISDGVFSGNRNLESITIGKNVSLIGAGAFKDCEELKEVIFVEGEGGAATLEIGANAFDGCDSYSFTTLVLPARTTKVGAYAFANMEYLQNVTLNEGLEEISDYMFYDYSKLSSIEIPASVKRIGEGAFSTSSYSRYSGSFAVTFAANSQLTRIEPCAFEKVYTSSTGKTLEIPKGVTYIGYRAFYGANFESVTIPNTVTFIGAEAFAASSSYSAPLKSVTFADDGTQDLILGGLDSRYINRGNSLTDVPRPYEGRVFYNQSKITSIALPERVTFIGEETFNYCEGLESLIFGENSRLKHIGSSAFR